MDRKGKSRPEPRRTKTFRELRSDQHLAEKTGHPEAGGGSGEEAVPEAERRQVKEKAIS